jgi:hypothetical protein
MGLLSNTYGRFGDRRQQLDLATRAVDRAHRALEQKRPHLTLTAVERFYAEALRANGRPGDAIPILWRVLKDQQQLDPMPTMRVRHAKMQLARALLSTGRIDEGLPLLRESVALEREQNPAESDDRRSYSELLAAALASAWRTDEALGEEDRLEGIVGRLRIEPPPATFRRHIRRAWLLACRGDSQHAEALASEAAAATSDGEVRAEALRVSAFNARMQAGPGGDGRDAAPGLRRPAGVPTRLQLQSAAAGAGDGPARGRQRRGGEASSSRDAGEHFQRGQIEPSPLAATCAGGFGPPGAPEWRRRRGGSPPPSADSILGAHQRGKRLARRGAVLAGPRPLRPGRRGDGAARGRGGRVHAPQVAAAGNAAAGRPSARLLPVSCTPRCAGGYHPRAWHGSWSPVPPLASG